MLQVIKKFFLNTSLHGLKFIAARNRMLLERCVWIVLVIISAIFASIMLYYGYYGLKDDGVRIVLDSTSTPLWDALFPAVTVCSFNQISRARAERASKSINTSFYLKSGDVKLNLKNLFYLTLSSNLETSHWNLSKFQHLLEFNDIDASNLFRNISVKCDDMFDVCHWKGRKKLCHSLFEPVETNMGFCCSFNYYGRKKITNNKQFSLPNLPRRLSGIGLKSALKIYLKTEVDDYFAGEISSYGYKIIIHNPYDHPEVGMPNILLGANETAFITVDPVIRRCEEPMNYMKPKLRNCYFKHEKELHNYHYTFNNCMLECSMKLIIRLCSCVPFYYYSSEGNFTNIRICNLRDKYCIEKHRHFIMSSVPGVNKTLNLYEEGYYSHFSNCNCLLDCNYFHYVIASSTGRLRDHSETIGFQLFHDSKVSNRSFFRVYYTSLLSEKYKYINNNSWYAILSLSGGILSLFIGFNFGCILEIIYYFMLHPLMNCKLEQ